MQAEHEEHFRRPAADAFDLRQLLDDRLIVQRVERVEVHSSRR